MNLGLRPSLKHLDSFSKTVDIGPVAFKVDPGKYRPLHLKGNDRPGKRGSIHQNDISRIEKQASAQIQPLLTGRSDQDIFFRNSDMILFQEEDDGFDQVGFTGYVRILHDRVDAFPEPPFRSASQLIHEKGVRRWQPARQ